MTFVKRFLMDLGIRIEPLTAAIAERAAELRARHRSLRLPDALVLATADARGATALTCDRSWPRVSTGNRRRVPRAYAPRREPGAPSVGASGQRAGQPSKGPVASASASGAKPSVRARATSRGKT